MGQLETVAAAYGALAEGRPEALIELLHPDVEWLEYGGLRETRCLHGAEAVAHVLVDGAAGRSLEVTGIAKVGGGALAIGFVEPWWQERRRGLAGRLASLLHGDAHQVATIDGRICRIESYTTSLAPAGGHRHGASDLLGPR